MLVNNAGSSKFAGPGQEMEVFEEMVRVHLGCCAVQDDSSEKRLGDEFGFAGKGFVARNPGGLMGVWAKENTREALFAAMLKREVFATSGPRIEPRFFAGWDIPTSACDSDMPTVAYTGGVAMGSVLNTSGRSHSPLFVAAATADAQGHALQRLQLIKVWTGADQQIHQRVVDLDGSRPGEAWVDPATCATGGVGHRQLCSTWQDPEFDPEQRAVYYLRVLENPSCRWSWCQCLDYPEDERPAACRDPSIPRFIQERAWSSPIWLGEQAGDELDF